MSNFMMGSIKYFNGDKTRFTTKIYKVKFETVGWLHFLGTPMFVRTLLLNWSFGATFVEDCSTAVAIFGQVVVAALL